MKLFDSFFIKKIGIGIICTVFYGTVFSQKTLNFDYKISDEEVYLYVSANTLSTQLISIAKKMNSIDGLKLDIRNSKFDKNGVITFLDLEVKTPDGYSGTTKAKKKDLKLARCGFYWNRKRDGDFPFRTGSIDQY